MIKDRPFDLSTFLSKQDMEELVKYRKKAYCIERLKVTLDKDCYRKLMNNFYNKIAYEIEPILQLNQLWLEKVFGFKGEMRINVDTQHGDAIYICPKTKRYVEIELKHISMITCEYGCTSQYNDGRHYYDIGGKSWKFRTLASEFKDDYTLLLMGDSETDDLVDAIALDKNQMKTLLSQNVPNNYNGGTIPIAIAYRHVKDHTHMVGNKVQPNYTAMLTKYAEDNGIVYRKAKGGSYYSDLQTRSIAVNQKEVVQWLLNNSSDTSLLAFSNILGIKPDQLDRVFNN